MKRILSILLVLMLSLGLFVPAAALARTPIVGNDGLLVMSPEEYNNDIDDCDTIGQQDNYYYYKYYNCGKESSGGNDAEWAKFEQYMNALIDSGYYELVETYHSESGRIDTWSLKYTGPGSVKRTFKTNKNQTEHASLVVDSFYGDVYVFYSLDIITNDLEDTQYRLGKSIFDSNSSGGSGGGGSIPSGGRTEEHCGICGGSGKRDCGSCFGRGTVGYGSDLRDCPNFSCSGGKVDCWTCGGDGKK